MTPDDSDKRLRAKIERSFVPADLCTTDPAAIEAMLDADKAEPFPQEKVERMLKKLKGDVPLGERKQEEEENKPKRYILIRAINSLGDEHRVALPFEEHRLSVARKLISGYIDTLIKRGDRVTYRVVSRLRGDEVILADA